MLCRPVLGIRVHISTYDCAHHCLHSHLLISLLLKLNRCPFYNQDPPPHQLHSLGVSSGFKRITTITTKQHGNVLVSLEQRKLPFTHFLHTHFINHSEGYPTDQSRVSIYERDVQLAIEIKWVMNANYFLL